MPKRESYIRIRLYDKEKEEWEKYAEENKFPSVSQFVRYVISEYMEHGLRRTINTGNNNNNVSKTDLLRIIEDERREKEKERDEYFKKIDEILLERRKELNITIEHNIKGKILKWVEKFNGKLTSEELAELVNLPEPDTIDILNKMQGQHLVKLNKKMKYEVISNENSDSN
ncbi:MAG: hypothetical protein ACFFDF_11270 [Candidatus Odinarchaeota archaeon]